MSGLFWRKFAQLLLENPKVEDSTSRVRFIRFSDYALEVEIYCYILESDYLAYVATQEALLLSIMDALEKAGVVVALPTQTTFVTQDSWVESGKSKGRKGSDRKNARSGSSGTTKTSAKFVT